MSLRLVCADVPAVFGAHVSQITVQHRDGRAPSVRHRHLGLTGSTIKLVCVIALGMLKRVGNVIGAPFASLYRLRPLRDHNVLKAVVSHIVANAEGGLVAGSAARRVNVSNDIKKPESQNSGSGRKYNWSTRQPSKPFGNDSARVMWVVLTCAIFSDVRIAS